MSNDTESKLERLKYEKKVILEQKENMERKLDYSRVQLKSQLSRLPVTASNPVENTILSNSTMINRGHQNLLPMYQRANSTKSTIELQKQRLQNITEQLNRIEQNIKMIESDE